MKQGERRADLQNLAPTPGPRVQVIRESFYAQVALELRSGSEGARQTNTGVKAAKQSERQGHKVRKEMCISLQPGPRANLRKMKQKLSARTNMSPDRNRDGEHPSQGQMRAESKARKKEWFILGAPRS